METVRSLTMRELPDSGVLCVALAHNEIRRIQDFLRHHRTLGIVHFLIVDDSSTDGTRQFLEAQADVTLFVPQATSYREHKALWRKDILDRYAQGRWVLLPDVDELLVYPHCETRSIALLSEHLDREGSQAVFAPMVEMYADAPLDHQVYREGASMLAAFPYFDSEGYRLVRPSGRHLARFPTPPLDLHGGPRERLFYGYGRSALGPVSKWVLARFAHERRSMDPNRLERLGNAVARFLLRRKMPQPPLVMSKIALVRWLPSLSFPGGPHSISAPLRLSKVWGALLHFKFMDLPGEAAYRVARGQHAKGAIHYQHVLTRGGFERSPMYDGSCKYQDWRDLLECGLLRTSAGWTAYERGE